MGYEEYKKGYRDGLKDGLTQRHTNNNRNLLPVQNIQKPVQDRPKQGAGQGVGLVEKVKKEIEEKPVGFMIKLIMGCVFFFLILKLGQIILF